FAPKAETAHENYNISRNFVLYSIPKSLCPREELTGPAGIESGTDRAGAPDATAGLTVPIPIMQSLAQVRGHKEEGTPGLHLFQDPDNHPDDPDSPPHRYCKPDRLG